MSRANCRCDDCQRSYGDRGGPHDGYPCATCHGTSVDVDPEIVAANASDMLRALEAAAAILRRIFAADRAGDPARYANAIADARNVLRVVDDAIDAVETAS